MTRLTHRDLQSLTDCIRKIYSDMEPDAWHHRLLSVISKIISFNGISYNKIDPLNQKVVYHERPSSYISPIDIPIYEKYMHDHPIMKIFYPALIKRHPFKDGIEGRIRRMQSDYIRHPEGRTLKISDLLTNNQFRSLGLYNEFYRKYDVEYQMGMALSKRPDMAEAIAVNRDGKDFTERDRLMLNLLGPHIIQAYKNAEAVSAIQRNVQASTQAKTIDSLTLRESELLHWLAQGKDNATIAAIMQVKVCTVKKHMENIFAKLGVENRTAAAMMAMGRQRDTSALLNANRRA